MPLPPRNPPSFAVERAREILSAFLFTFIAARVMVYLIMSRTIDSLYLHIGSTHIHHLNYGIFLLSAVGGYVIMREPQDWKITLAAWVYGIGLALTFDEFGMWLHLGGSYWQRASFDAVTVIAALFGLFAAAPEIRRFREIHWTVTVLLLVALIFFGVITHHAVHYLGERWGPALQQLEAGSPR